MREMEIQHARQVLDAAGGNKTRAAEILGISKPTLYRLLSEEEKIAREEKEPARPPDPVPSEEGEASGGAV